MTNHLDACQFADQATFATVEVVDHRRLASTIFQMRFRCPEMATQIRPGQFFMVRIAGRDDPLLARPFALYDVDADRDCVDFIYVVKGNLTRPLSRLAAGDQLEVWGPLGNGFSLQPADHLVIAAGGIGYTPFLAVTKSYLALDQYGDAPLQQRAKRVTFCCGARTATELVGLEDFRDAGADVRTATDDGSAGHHGLVTDLVRDALAEDSVAQHVLACGPPAMMEAVAMLAESAGVSCEVSLETPMACGVGICFTCVAKVRQPDGEWDFRRTCVEGPVFPAQKICWD